VDRLLERDQVAANAEFFESEFGDFRLRGFFPIEG